MRRRTGFALFALLGLAAGLARAAPPRAGGLPAEDPVPLYTNADLERFRYATPPDVAAPARVSDDWGFVQEFLDRQYARLDAEFARDLARAEADRQAAPLRPHYVAPYMGIYGSPYSGIRPWRYPGGGNRPVAYRQDIHNSYRPLGARPSMQGGGPRPARGNHRGGRAR